MKKILLSIVAVGLISTNLSAGAYAGHPHVSEVDTICIGMLSFGRDLTRHSTNGSYQNLTDAQNKFYLKYSQREVKGLSPYVMMVSTDLATSLASGAVSNSEMIQNMKNCTALVGMKF